MTEVNVIGPLEQAREYISSGYSVIPILPHEKKCVLPLWEQFSQRQPTEQELAKWFEGKTWEDVNIGIVADNPHRILDIDDGRLWSFFFDISPEQLEGTVRSGSDEGTKYHVYFVCRESIETTELKGVVEYKAEKRYCVAPPSIHPSGQRYRWISSMKSHAISKKQCEEIGEKIAFLKKHYENFDALVNAWPENLDVAHNLHLHLAGYLYKNKVKIKDAVRACQLLVLLSRDERELEDRLKCVETTYEIRELDKVAGYSALLSDLTQIFSNDAAKAEDFIQKLSAGLGIKRKEEPIVKVKDVSNYPRTSLNALMDFWHKNFYIEDDAPLLIELGTAATNSIEGDPVWLLVVGPPSSIKSETIRSLGDEPTNKVWPISTLTANTFISGQGKGGSLLPHLDGKIVTIKDFTTLLEKNKDARNEILSQLREIYDGYFSKATGNEDASYQNAKCRITLLAGVTPVIDLFDAVSGLLGDRFLKVRVTAGDPLETGKKAIEAASRETDIRKQLYSLTMGFLNTVKVERIPLTEEVRDKLIELATFTAKARTAVARDWRGTIQYLPQPEGIARIFKQFLKLAWGICAVTGSQTIDEVVLGLIARVARDSVDQRRVTVLSRLIAVNGPRKTSEVASMLELPTDTTLRILEEIHLLGFVSKDVSLDKDGNEAANRGYVWEASSPTILTTEKYQWDKTNGALNRVYGLFFGDGHTLRFTPSSIEHAITISEEVHKGNTSKVSDEAPKEDIVRPHPINNPYKSGFCEPCGTNYGLDLIREHMKHVHGAGQN